MGSVRSNDFGVSRPLLLQFKLKSVQCIYCKGEMAWFIFANIEIHLSIPTHPPLSCISGQMTLST